MKLGRVLKILKFEQSDWLKKYINFNTDKRKNAANSFEKVDFKWMDNIVYGKTIKNLRKKGKVRLVNNVKDYKKFCFTVNI